MKLLDTILSATHNHLRTQRFHVFQFLNALLLYFWTGHHFFGRFGENRVGQRIRVLLPWNKKKSATCVLSGARTLHSLSQMTIRVRNPSVILDWAGAPSQDQRIRRSACTESMQKPQIVSKSLTALTRISTAI
jgi:hypothetical protein